MAENLEKQSFTFFASLPPYIGVSGSLVSRTRKISMRSIDWYQQILISRLAARYSAVFVFFIVKAFGQCRRSQLWRTCLEEGDRGTQSIMTVVMVVVMVMVMVVVVFLENKRAPSSQGGEAGAALLAHASWRTCKVRVSLRLT